MVESTAKNTAEHCCSQMQYSNVKVYIAHESISPMAQNHKKDFTSLTLSHNMVNSGLYWNHNVNCTVCRGIVPLV